MVARRNSSFRLTHRWQLDLKTEKVTSLSPGLGTLTNKLVPKPFQTEKFHDETIQKEKKFVPVAESVRNKILTLSSLIYAAKMYKI